MTVAISPERAFADGISPEILILVAQWHEERAALIDRSIAQPSKKRKPIGTASDADRHERIASELRAVASHVDTLTAMREAA